MATLTPNYNLSKPESTDKLSDFMGTYNNNMDIIDQNLGGGGGGSSTLAGLTDVVLSALQDGNFLRYDATLRKWVNADGDPVSVSDLTDVELTNLSDGQFLVYDADTQKWVNVSITIPDMSNYYNKTEVDDIVDDIRQVPDASGANIGDVLTHTASGEGWYPPAKELPNYTSGDAAKVLTVDSNGNLIWASAGGGDTVTWTQIINSGTKIATISINGVPTDVYAPNGGGGNGHVIENASGVDMAARANLQFIGADVTDDSTNDRTIVDMSYTEISYEDWLALTEQEKETGRWDVIGAPEEGGSGGHTIQNESGSDMTERANLQFIGADVTDDSANDRTVVDMSYTEISYEDWLALTEQEKETGRWDVVGAPGGDSSGGHTIQNESGTDMTERANLQFVGADVTDDSTNDRTVVDMSYTEISYEDWLALTEQEKETGRWDVVGVPEEDTQNGHIIQNESGVDMAARANLQFIGADVSDDSADDCTVVDMSYTEISYANWLLLSQQEKENGRWDVTDVPGVEGTISFDLMTKLWENPNPSAAFAAQNVTLASDDYDLLLYLYEVSRTSLEYVMSQLAIKSKNGTMLDFASGSTTGTQNWRRFVQRVSDTVVSFEDCYTFIGTSSGSVTNERLIPYQIYGIKLQQTVEINAIAPDVSTLASKCMLSDGVTSVEDKVDELTDYVVDTTTISGVKITKMGHLVMLSIDKTITMNGSRWVSVGIVPYKPITEIFGVAKQNAVDKIISIDLMVSGNLAVMGSGSSAILVRGSLTYITND